MNDRMIIGVGYKAGSGKDEVANILVRKHGFLKASFAGKLKQDCIHMFGWDPDWPYTAEGKATVCPVTGRTVREVLQLYGEMMRRTFGDDIWIRLLFRELEQDQINSVVISDVRYRNEFDFIKKIGVLCRVDRPEHLRAQSVTQGIEGHPSETELDGVKGWHAILVNDSSLDKLKEGVDRMVNTYSELRHGLKYLWTPHQPPSQTDHEPDEQPVV